MEKLQVDCTTCQVRGTGCDDCVMSVLLGMPGDGPVELVDEEQRALEALAGSGMLPPLRLVQPVREVDHRVEIEELPDDWEEFFGDDPDGFARDQNVI